MKLIDGWRHAWRMFSVQAMALAIAIQGAWPAIPPELKETIPPNVVHWMTLGLLAAGIVGRMVKQDSVSGDGKPE